MENIFQQLEAEHKVILNFLLLFDQKMKNRKALDLIFFDNALKFIEIYMDKLHHGKEENILFPYAENTGVPRQGGSQCTKYFGLFLERRFLDEVSQIIKQPEYSDIPTHQFPEAVIKIVEANSALKIPLEDHTSGYYLKSLIKIELDKIRVNKNHNTNQFLTFCSLFSEMLSMHIEKEENCLFTVLKERIPKNKVDEMSERANLMEKALQSELQSISDFKDSL